MHGTLYIVATPIGNLGDITFRALETLRSVDRIACEDTRITKKLLTHYNIQKKLIGYREENEEQQAEKIVSLLKRGESIALVSDAGTPSISDPGYRVVHNAAEEGIPVIPIPGSSAAIAALSVSGLPTDAFLFLGFLPQRDGKKRKRLEAVKDHPYTIILYESPYRVLKTLTIIEEILGVKQISVSRELTKKFEETIRGYTSDVLQKLQERETLKGEFVIIINNR